MDNKYTTKCLDCGRQIKFSNDIQVGDVLVCENTETQEGCGVELEVIRVDRTNPENPIVTVDYLIVEK